MVVEELDQPVTDGQESQALQVCGGVMNDVQCRKPWRSPVR